MLTKIEYGESLVTSTFTDLFLGPGRARDTSTHTSGMCPFPVLPGRGQVGHRRHLHVPRPLPRLCERRPPGSEHRRRRALRVHSTSTASELLPSRATPEPIPRETTEPTARESRGGGSGDLPSRERSRSRDVL